MKYSTLSFIISSSILLHACGSSNDIQNHTTDPNPNQNSQHQSNSHNINGNQSSNNSNQAANPSHNSNQQNNQNDFTPNISSGNAPKPKNNIIISSNNHQNDDDDDNDAPIPAPPKINLNTLTPDKANELVRKAEEKLQKATIEKDAAKQKEDIAERAYKQAVDNLKSAAEELGSADKSELPIALQNFKTAKETVDKLANDLASKMAKTKKAEQVEAMATLEKELADNAKKFVDDKVTEPEAVLDKIKAEQDAKQAVAEKKELEIKKELLESEAKVIADTVEYLKDQNETIKDKVLNDSNVTPEAKKEAEAKIKENEDKIAKLNKQNKEKTQAAKDLNNPIEKADVDVKSTAEDLKEAQEGIKYRGVYASDGKYEASTSYKNVKKVVAATPRISSKPDEWMQEWTLFIKDGDKEVTIDTSKLKGSLHFAGTKTGPVAHFDKDNNNILVNRGGKYFIQGHIGDKSNSDFFNAGLVTPEENISKSLGTVKYDNTAVSANDAFLVTKDGANATRLVAKVSEASADFGERIFKGKFTDFAKYSIDVTGQVGSSSDYSGITEPVEFRADIKGNKFMPAKDLEPNKARVYGYFYGDGAKEAGGLVEHKLFNGTFGVRAKD